MLIDFQCPRCGTRLRAPSRMAGQTGKCKKCGTELRVPMVAAPVQSANDIFDPIPGAKENHALPPPLIPQGQGSKRIDFDGGHRIISALSMRAQTIRLKAMAKKLLEAMAKKKGEQSTLEWFLWGNLFKVTPEQAAVQTSLGIGSILFGTMALQWVLRYPHRADFRLRATLAISLVVIGLVLLGMGVRKIVKLLQDRR